MERRPAELDATLRGLELALADDPTDQATRNAMLDYLEDTGTAGVDRVEEGGPLMADKETPAYWTPTLTPPSPEEATPPRPACESMLRTLREVKGVTFEYRVLTDDELADAARELATGPDGKLDEGVLGWLMR